MTSVAFNLLVGGVTLLLLLALDRAEGYLRTRRAKAQV